MWRVFRISILYWYVFNSNFDCILVVWVEIFLCFIIFRSLMFNDLRSIELLCGNQFVNDAKLKIFQQRFLVCISTNLKKKRKSNWWVSKENECRLLYWSLDKCDHFVYRIMIGYQNKLSSQMSKRRAKWLVLCLVMSTRHVKFLSKNRL